MNINKLFFFVIFSGDEGYEAENGKLAGMSDLSEKEKKNGILAAISLFIIFAALLIRLTALAAKSLYVDEGVTVFICQRPLASIVPLMMDISEVHPPLYFWLVNIWMGVWKTLGIALSYTVWLRLSSVLFGVLSVWLTYCLARRLVGEKAALLASGFLALSSFHVYYSQELRMYPLLLCLMLSSFVLFLMMIEKPSVSRGIGLAVVTGLALLTHYYAFYIIMIEVLWGIYLFLGTGSKGIAADSGDMGAKGSGICVKNIFYAVVSSILSVLFFIPWLVYFMKQSRAQDFTLRVNPSLWNIPEIFSYISFGQAVPPSWNQGSHFFAMLGIIPIALVLLSLCIKWGKAGQTDNGGVKFFNTCMGRNLAGIYLFTPLLITLIVSFMTRFHIFEFKYFLIICPAFWILASSLIDRAKPAGVKIFITLLFLVLNILTLLNSQFNQYYYPQDWRKAAAVVKSGVKPGELVVVHPSMMASSFLFYYNDVKNLVPLDFPQDPRLGMLKDCKGIWFVSTPNHPFVGQAGLVRYLFSSYPSKKIMETENYLPSNVLRIDYLETKPEENVDR